MSAKNFLMLPEETIMSKIYLIRGKKVMLDRDLAELYGVDTKQLKRAVRRNERRFPPDFAFGLTQDEFGILRSQFGTSSWGKRRVCFPRFISPERTSDSTPVRQSGVERCNSNIESRRDDR